MTDRESLDPRMTPNILVAECSRMTRLQQADYLRPLTGKWLKIRGFVFASTDNRPLAGFGVTIIVSDPASAIDVYCAFYGDYERLALVAPDDVVEVEGVLGEVSGRKMKLDSCILLDTIDGSRVNEVVTRDQHLRAVLGSIREPDQEGALRATVIEGLQLKDVASALHKTETAVAIAAGLVQVRAKHETLELSNFEKSTAQSYLNIMIEVAQMPEPDVNIFWLALERASYIAGIASLVAAVIALK